ncbi:DUF397 domain-containing protein [Streptomyces glaucosporus]|uniref:DUF397 domain-containing protein n=1 Tax=Streptomyces glaucosporus TaxID=284044 RepID=A0ABP5UTU3_9ACTN
MTFTSSAEDASTLTWIKSSHSADDGPACVEVAATPATVHVRDSKRIQGPHLAIAPNAWAGFLAYAADR